MPIWAQMEKTGNQGQGVNQKNPSSTRIKTLKSNTIVYNHIFLHCSPVYAWLVSPEYACPEFYLLLASCPQLSIVVPESCALVRGPR